jgi:predicted nucleic-acid-binding Zn-ribbon protein
MKGCIMNEENNCLRCGSTNVKPGALESTGKIYARPKDAKLETLLKTGVLVNVNICFDCGHVEMVVVTNELKSVMPAS